MIATTSSDNNVSCALPHSLSVAIIKFWLFMHSQEVIMAIGDLLDETEEEMMAGFEAMDRDFAGIRTGKASTSLVENIDVDYYGTATRLKEIAGITTPEPRLIVIQPWDKNALGPIEKAIQTSNIGIMPVSDGRVVRLPLPELSEERREDLAKQVKRRAEEAKVEMRNHRRDGNEAAKKAHKNSDITEDVMHDIMEGIQKLTDDYIKQIDDTTKAKEAEILTV
jgi:ribosome recycling factor